MEFCTQCGYRDDICRCFSYNDHSHRDHSHMDPWCPPDPDPDPKPHPKPPPPPPPRKKKKLVTDKICGNIEQTCNGEFVEYWRAIGFSSLPSATLSVINKSDCPMTVRAGTGGGDDVILFTISEKGQTKSVSLSQIANLEVSCDGVGNSRCFGTYCINLHFEKDCE
ncbi:hypothetical protein JOC95_000583 [Bacillus tianshenii]|uniref:Endospore appendages core domain-containing protein n=1 Tax=Sutcliffiella tianshenii TaxID=1463404 RepID=A0ABS2NVR9_9BACI|nr:S-Ena type endospore appendage [Bacillus tianshenii]MBM7618741.1 hypothetical protein [Bacillus tianshenii]